MNSACVAQDERVRQHAWCQSTQARIVPTSKNRNFVARFKCGDEGAVDALVSRHHGTQGSR